MSDLANYSILDKVVITFIVFASVIDFLSYFLEMIQDYLFCTAILLISDTFYVIGPF